MCFFTAIIYFSCNVLNVNSLECVSMNNYECKIRSEIINIHTNEPKFYSYSIKRNRCKYSFNTSNNPYVNLCSPETIKNINVKEFNLQPMKQDI